jgi:DNA primase small subunit
LFKTVERELVFDIDMTDYDDIRTCCSGAAICQRCWPYMTMAIKVIDCALREDFAFRNILWIYSGRRGVHCWVCDPEARSLPNDARAAVVEYLSIHTGSTENSDKKIKQSFENPHPMLRRAYGILEPYFASHIADEAGQGLLARKDRYMKILNTLPNEAIRRELYEKWDKEDKLTGQQRWQMLRIATTATPEPSVAQQQQFKKKKVNFAELESWRMELVFTHCYARLDANVSKTQNHLLKSAFCVHPKTGRVCVPIDPKQADAFDPFTVPTVRTLCAEVRIVHPVSSVLFPLPSI